MRLIPKEPGNYSWAGHLGARMLKPVVVEIANSSTTLVFTNTRSQAEIWYRLILAERPDWVGQIALHHGSLDKEVRDWVEQGLKVGQLKAVVVTSSLDLGVDFLPVERVLQIGSVKGVARLIQRAGRNGHAPMRTSRITLVPINTLVQIEAAAAHRQPSRWMCWCSISSPWHSLAVICPMRCLMKFARLLLTEISRAWSLIEHWPFASVVVIHSLGIQTITASSQVLMASIACPIVPLRGGIA